MEEKYKQKIMAILTRGNSLDWHYIVGEAFLNDVFPQIYHNLEDLPLKEDLIPKEVLTTLKAAYHMSIAHSMVRLDILRCILKVCNEAGIRAMPIKGIVLAEKIYPQRHLRTMNDIDLLIPEIDKDKKTWDSLRRMILNLQEKYGNMYVKVGFHSSWRINVGNSWQANTRARRTSMGFWRSTFETERIWRRAAESLIEGVKTTTMSVEDMFLMSCYHSLAHSRLNLRDLCDVHAILKLYGDRLEWNYIFDTAKRTRLSVPIYYTLFLIHYLFNCTKMPKNILGRLEAIWEVKMLKPLLKTWSPRGEVFESIYQLYKEICRLRSLGVPDTLILYIRYRKETIKRLAEIVNLPMKRWGC